MSSIKTEKELKRILDIESLDDLKKPDIQKKFIGKIKNNELSPELLKSALAVVPELTKAFTEVIKTMGEIGTSLEETKRIRWQILQELAASGNLTGDQILEAMSIIAEIENNESIDWESIFDRALVVLGAVAGVVIFILTRGRFRLR